MILLGILLAFAVSAVCGLINGALIAYVRVPAIIATLGTQGLFLGIAIGITRGSGIGGFPDPFLFIGNGEVAGIPMQFLIYLAVALLVGLLLTRTRQGFSMRMYGSSPLVSRFSGVNNEAVLMRTYLTTGLLAGAASIIVISGVNSIRPGYGSEYLLISVLIAILGGTDPAGGFGTALGLTLGIFIMQVLQSGLNILNFSPFFKKFMWGLLLVALMVFHHFRRRYSQRRAARTLRGGARAGRGPGIGAGRRPRMSDYLLGIDAGTESFRAGVFDPAGKCLGFGVSPNRTVHPHPGWAEQSPARLGNGPGGLDPQGPGGQPRGAEADPRHRPGRHQLHRGLPGRDRPAAAGGGDLDGHPRRQGSRGGGGHRGPGPGLRGPRQRLGRVVPLQDRLGEAPRAGGVRQASRTVFELTDWLAFRLTGEKTVNIDTATIRWFYNARRGGFPLSLYRKMGLEDLLAKVPERIVKIGEVVGGLSPEMARATGLPAGIPVAGGGADAYMGVIGINALAPGTIALITGSSHLQIGITDREIHARGLFGSFPEALVPGLAGHRGAGRSPPARWCAGSPRTSWARTLPPRRRKAGRSVYDELNARAASIPPGAEGLVVLEHWQGNRTPWTDPWSRGVIRGLTLGHGPAHVYRAILEGVAFGTEVILQKMAQEGVRIDSIVACGGATPARCGCRSTPT